MNDYVDIISRKSVENSTVYTVQIENEESDLYVDVMCIPKNPPYVLPINMWSEAQWDERETLVSEWKYDVQIVSDQRGEAIVSNNRFQAVDFHLGMDYAKKIVEKVIQYRRDADHDLVERAYTSCLYEKLCNEPCYIMIDGECLYAVVKDNDIYEATVIPRYDHMEKADFIVDKFGEAQVIGEVPLLIKETMPDVKFAVLSFYDELSEEKQEESELTNNL